MSDNGTMGEEPEGDSMGALVQVGIGILAVCACAVWTMICIMSPGCRMLGKFILRSYDADWYDDKFGGGDRTAAEVAGRKRQLEENSKVHPLRQDFETTRKRHCHGDPKVLARNKMHSAGHRPAKRHKRHRGDPHPRGPGPDDHKTSSHASTSQAQRH